MAFASMTRMERVAGAAYVAAVLLLSAAYLSGNSALAIAACVCFLTGYSCSLWQRRREFQKGPPSARIPASAALAVGTIVLVALSILAALVGGIVALLRHMTFLEGAWDAVRLLLWMAAAAFLLAGFERLVTRPKRPNGAN